MKPAWVIFRAAFAVLGMLSVALSVPRAKADEFDLLFMEFDARPMSEAEKRFVQTGLAFEGDYQGLVDGAWGKRSQEALERYVAREFPSVDANKPKFIHALSLVMTVASKIKELGWGDRYFPGAGLSLAAPWGIVSPIDESDTRWETANGDLYLRYLISTRWQVVARHDKVQSFHTAVSEPYLVRRPDRMVTSIQYAGGGGIYLRSDRLHGEWVSVLIAAKEPQYDLLGVMSTGIHFGPPRDWKLRDGSLLDRVLQTGIRFFEAEDEHERATDRQPVASAKQPPTSRRNETTGDRPKGSGTAFFVNNTDLVTADHVVSECRRITLEDGTAITIIDSDRTIDLAVLTSPKRSRDWLPLSNRGHPRLGEQAYVLGYPYYQLIGTALNLTTGNVSALSGVGDDHRFISISAPVQPGNSGGPLLNGRGEILGVVNARLSDLAIAEATGSLPQNINYAITGNELINFLDRAGVLFPSGQPVPINMEEGAPDTVQRAVVPVLCW